MGTLTRLAIFVMMLTIFLVGGPVFAAPHTINLQSIIYDMDGAVTEKAFVDIIVKILDGENNVLFTEEHPDVPVVGGAVNLEIGSINEIPLSTLDPATGTKFIDVLVDNTHPDDLMPLAAVPYSMWSEKSLSVIPDSIGSIEIKNGSIKPEDLDPSLSFANVSGQIADGQIPTVIVRQTALDAHINSTTSHSASSITLSGFFGHFVASNVQDAIKAIDQQLSGEVVDRRTGQRNLNTNLTSEVTARQGGDTALTTSLNAHAGATAAHGSDGNVVGATTLANAIGAHASQTSNVHGLTTAAGNLVGTDAVQILTNKTLENPTIHHGTIAGDITTDDARCNSEAGHPCWMDGVDVGTLPGLIAAEATAREGADTTLGTRIDGVNTAITTEASTRSTADTALGGRIDAHIISSNTSAHTFGNISGTIGTTQIADNAVTGAKINDGAVTGADIADGTIAFIDLGSNSCSSGQVMKFNGSSWACGTDIDTDTSTTYAAANGLSLSGTTFSANFGSSGGEAGSVNTIARSDHNHDTAYVNAGGDVMTGPLTMNANIEMQATRTVDGVDVSELASDFAASRTADIPFTRVSGQISTTQVPQFMRPFAFGTITYATIVANAYNIASAADNGGTGPSGPCSHITFGTAAPDENYIVLITPHQSGIGYGIPTISGKSTTSFDFCFGSGIARADVLVFHP